MSQTAQQATNGVNVQQLVETIDLVREQPNLAAFRFRARNTWHGGANSTTEILGFDGAGLEDAPRADTLPLKADEPPALLGDDTAPNAVEAVLHALAACLGVGFVYNAAARGIEVRSLTFEMEGDLDLQAFLGISDARRPGYENIRVTYQVDCDASDEDVDELCAYVQRTSPVLDVLRNPVDVQVSRASA